MKAVLHIGTEKTGTTTIQEFLYLNRPILADHGVLFPRAFGERNHRFLASFADRPPWRLFNQFTSARDDLERAALRDGWRDTFKEEITKRKCTHVLLSNEHLHSHLNTKEQLLDLSSLLREWCNEIQVVVYFRRQDQMAVSRYSTALKAGRLPKHHFDVGRPWLYQHLQSYQLWSETFGVTNVVARLFDKAYFVNGNLLDDFSVAADLPCSAKDMRSPPTMNEALSADAECLLIALNELSAAGNLKISPAQRRKMVAMLVEQFPGASRRPTREDALRFYEPFRKDNDELCRRLGWDIAGGFSEDFSSYQEGQDPDFADRCAWARVYWPTLMKQFTQRGEGLASPG